MLAFRGAMMECQHGKKVPVFAGIIIYRPDTRSAVARLMFSRQSEPMGGVKKGGGDAAGAGTIPLFIEHRRGSDFPLETGESRLSLLPWQGLPIQVASLRAAPSYRVRKEKESQCRRVDTRGFVGHRLDRKSVV